MAFTRWKYGVEHNRRADDDKSNGLRWLLVALGILLVVSFILARLFARQQPARIEAEDRPAAEPAMEPVIRISVSPAAMARFTNGRTAAVELTIILFIFILLFLFFQARDYTCVRHCVRRW